MKHFILAFFLFSANLFARAQPDTRLAERLDSLLAATQQMDIETILDFTYPKIFTIATREQLIEAMEGSFEAEEFSTAFDSVRLTKIFPVFTTDEGRFAKITHEMLMRMKFRGPLDSAEQVVMKAAFEAQFGANHVRYEESENTFVIFVEAMLVAIKDEFAKEWSFVNYEEEDMMTELLFSKEIIEKLKEYN